VKEWGGKAGREEWEGEGKVRERGERRGKECRERGGRARLKYLSRGPRVPSYATFCRNNISDI